VVSAGGVTVNILSEPIVAGSQITKSLKEIVLSTCAYNDRAM